MLFQVVPKRRKRIVPELEPINIAINIESVPVTKQSPARGTLEPERPVHPIPLESETLPEYENILISSHSGQDDSSLNQRFVSLADTVKPRPFLQILPDLGKQNDQIEGVVVLLLKVDKYGQVKDLVVSKNTTLSTFAEQAALEAAKRSKFLPGKIDNKPVEMWTRLEYGFTNP